VKIAERSDCNFHDNSNGRLKSLLELRPKYVIRDTFLTPFNDAISIPFLLPTIRDAISTSSDE
jgi:hypothetical protein